jgi:hypothetical protein
MPILGVIASSISGNLYNASYESIATVTVGSGGAADVTFSSIPSTYQHLQIRVIGRTSAASGSSSFYMQVNSDAGSNYSQHRIYGSGSSVTASADVSQTSIQLDRLATNGSTSGVFGAAVIDILDYANTNKYKTVRSLGGIDNNGSGFIMFNSGLWMNTSAISTLSFTLDSPNTFTQYTQFALYGIKGVV